MKYHLVIAEKATGIVLYSNGNRWFKGQPEPFLEFDDIEKAVSFALEYRSRNPHNECIVTDEGHVRELRVFR